MASSPAPATPPIAPARAGTTSSLRGILFIVVSAGVFACSDTMTKSLAATIPPVEIAWIRYLTLVMLLLPLVPFSGGLRVLRSQAPRLQFVRGIGMLGSALMFMLAIPHLSVADATAIFFISPILITALSIPFLGEVVGWRRWSAALVGLTGVIIVIRPGTSAFHAAGLLPLIGAAFWSFAAIATRKMSGGDGALTTMLYSGLIGLTILTLMVPFWFVMPTVAEMALGFAMGALSALGHWLVVLAYRHGKASVVAPYGYGQLIWAGGLSYLAFGTVPDVFTLTGASVIAASGVYTAYRERVRAIEEKQHAGRHP